MYDIIGLLKLLGKPINLPVTIILLLNTSVGIIISLAARTGMEEDQWISWCVSIAAMLFSVMLVSMKWFNRLLFYVLRPKGTCKKASETEYHERITPIFADAVQRARALMPSVSENIELYVIENDSVFVWSCGPNIVYVTTAAISELPDDEIGALIARECAHIGNRDFELLVLIFISNLPNVISLFVWFISDKFIAIMQDVMRRSSDNSTDGGFVVIACFLTRVVCFFLFLPIFLWMVFALLLNLYSMRRKELDADTLSVRLGYADALQSVLNKLFENEAWYKRIISPLPSLEKRMQNIQEVLNPSETPAA